MELRAVTIVAASLPLFCTACSLLNEPRFACNPVLSAGDSQCMTSEKCAVRDDPQVTECRPNGGNGAVENACQPTGGSDDCIPGLTCVSTTKGNGADNLCRRNCRIGMDSDCKDVVAPDGPYVCVAAAAALAKYGFCCPRSGC